MIHLIAGQNLAWPEPRVTAALTGPGAGLCALLLGPHYRVRANEDLVDRRRPARAGVEWVPGPPEGLLVDLARVDADVERILCVATGGDAQPVTVGLAAPSGEVLAAFSPAGTVMPAVVVVEIYRRDGAWKVRAVGQGYAGGLDQACSAHGLQPATQTQPTATPEVERSFEDLLRHTRMILDDASRTTASLRSTREFARRRWESELDEVVADPSLRLGQAGDAARQAARERHDAMVGEAAERHGRDLDQLLVEVGDLETELPAPLARWTSAGWDGWQPPRQLQFGIRVGDLALADAPRFTMPFLVPLPLPRPLWIEIDTTDAVATAMLRTVATRVLAATAAAQTRVSIIDIGGRRGTLGLPEVLLDGPVAKDATAASETLAALVEHIELLGMALGSGSADALDVGHRAGRLLLVTDFPTGLDESTLRQLLTVIERGPPLGVQVLVTGTHAGSLGVDLIDWLQDMFLRVPSQPGGHLVDGFGGVDWTFLPDGGPADAHGLEGVLELLADARPRNSGLRSPPAG